MTGRRGFTLVEVLVAIALVAAGGLAVLRLAREGADTVAAGADRTTALFLAVDELAAARLEPPPLGEHEVLAGSGLRVERRVRPTTHPALREVRVRVAPAGDAAGVELVEIVRAPRP